MRKENVIRGRILKEKAQMVRVNVPLVIDGKELARAVSETIHTENQKKYATSIQRRKRR